LVYEIGEGKIKLHDGDSRVILHKECNQVPEYSVEEFDAIIQECNWVIAGFNYQNEDVTQQYTGYEINFNSEGSVLAEEGDYQVEGSWSTQATTAGVGFILDMIEPLQELTNDWVL